MHMPAQINYQNQMNIAADTNGNHTGSSQGMVTPLGVQKAPMTDRNWNNSELKKFSVTQSKSNADIAEELRRFKMEGGTLESFQNHARSGEEGMIIT